MRAYKTIAIIFLSAFLLFNTPVHSYTVKAINVGEVAQYKGFLFDAEAEKAARIAVQQNDEYQDLILEQKVLLKNMDDALVNRNAMIKVLNARVENNKYYDAFYFFGGMIISGYLVNELHR